MIRPKQKIILTLLLTSLLSAACNLFGQKVAAGLVKSTNGGVDWQAINKIKSDSKVNLSGVNISSFAFSPGNSEQVYAGSYNAGLYKSDDAGGNWQLLLSKIGVYDIAVHPKDDQTLYVAGYFADHGKVLKTTDGGKSWQEIFNEEDAQNPIRTMA